MISVKLIQAVEDHWEQISAKVLRDIQRHPELEHLKRLPGSELKERAQEVTRNLGHWLMAKEQEWGCKYEGLGRHRFQEHVPLHEVVRAMQIVKDNITDFIREQGFCQTSVELYAEEELEYLVSRFFDAVVYHVVRGYEEALQSAAHAA
ncbi:MAG: hypothetical protein IT158_06980 [Bryobacterales bacterium]|nr:hypothetical protein [Bryobacterales bacterium]